MFLAASDGAGAAVGLVVVLLFLAFSLGSFVFWVWTLVDAVKRDDAQWVAAGQNKVVWILLIVILGFVGSVLYMFIPRPALKRV